MAGVIYRDKDGNPIVGGLSRGATNSDASIVGGLSPRGTRAFGADPSAVRSAAPESPRAFGAAAPMASQAYQDAAFEPSAYSTQSPALGPQPAAKFERGSAGELISDKGITQTLPGGLRRTANSSGTVYEQDDGSMKATVRSGTPRTAEEERFWAPVSGGGSGMRFTGNMIQARSTSDFLPKDVRPTAAPIDFANMSRADRRFALRNAVLGQGQDKTNTAYDLGLKKIASDDMRTVATQEAQMADAASLGGLRQSQARAADTATVAGQQIVDAQNKLVGLTPGTKEYDAASQQLLILSGKAGDTMKRNQIINLKETDPLNPAVQNEVPYEVTPEGVRRLPMVGPEAEMAAAKAEFNKGIANNADKGKSFLARPPADQEAAFQAFLKTRKK